MQILKSPTATASVANDFIDGISCTNMDVFLDDHPALPCLPLVSRISVAYPLQSDSAEGLIREAEQLHQRGIRYVCVRRQQILFIGEHVIHDILADAGIQVSCIGFAGGFTGSLGMSFDAATRDARRSIDLAADLGARSVVIVPGEQGLHTYSHAEKTIRLGLMDVAQYASQRHIRLLIPTDTVLVSPKDCFRPRECALSWLDGMGNPLIRPLIVVRGKSFACRLPSGWRESLAAGGSLRICHRCECYDENSQLVARVLTFIARNRGMNGFDKLLSET
ncbi:MAG: TIM barrel protein [Planctomycetaceae bacterium]